MKILRLKIKNIYLNITILLIRRLLRLATENLSLMNEKKEKASLYGPEYLKTIESASIDLKIASNHCKINFYKYFLKL